MVPHLTCINHFNFGVMEFYLYHVLFRVVLFSSIVGNSTYNGAVAELCC